LNEVDCKLNYSGSRRETHVIAGWLLRRFTTQKMGDSACKIRFHELIRGSLSLPR